MRAFVAAIDRLIVRERIDRLGDLRAAGAPGKDFKGHVEELDR